MRPILTLAVTTLCAVAYGCTSESPTSTPAPSETGSADSAGSGNGSAPAGNASAGNSQAGDAPADNVIGAAPGTMPAPKAAGDAAPTLTYFNIPG